jgi:hypothetical protein
MAIVSLGKFFKNNFKKCIHLAYLSQGRLNDSISESDH